MGSLRRVILFSFALLAVAPAGASAQVPVTETFRVPSVDGSKIWVEVTRPPGNAKVPVILTYSNFLAAQPWSNGKVGMIGGSYDGTTATMVAAAGDRAPGLAAIVPQAAISRWYGYALRVR